MERCGKYPEAFSVSHPPPIAAPNFVRVAPMLVELGGAAPNSQRSRKHRCQRCFLLEPAAENIVHDTGLGDHDAALLPMAGCIAALLDPPTPTTCTSFQVQCQVSLLRYARACGYTFYPYYYGHDRAVCLAQRPLSKATPPTRYTSIHSRA